MTTSTWPAWSWRTGANRCGASQACARSTSWHPCLERGDALRQALDVAAQALQLSEHPGLENVADAVGGIGEIARELLRGTAQRLGLLRGCRESALDR